LTQKEYERQRACITTSSASFEVREAALAKLEFKYNRNHSVEVARKQLIESASDTSDIGDGQ